MRKLEVFFDYICPYCLKGHNFLKDLLPDYPDIEVVWRPCEAHPRPEQYGFHSDLCIQGFFFALEHGVDIWEYNERIYHAALIDHVNIEDPEVIAGHIYDLLDYNALLKALYSCKYEKAISDTNDYADEQSDIWAVPSYRMDGRKLDSIEDMGITKAQLVAFLA